MSGGGLLEAGSGRQKHRMPSFPGGTMRENLCSTQMPTAEPERKHRDVSRKTVYYTVSRDRTGSQRAGRSHKRRPARVALVRVPETWPGDFFFKPARNMGTTPGVLPKTRRPVPSRPVTGSGTKRSRVLKRGRTPTRRQEMFAGDHTRALPSPRAQSRSIPGTSTGSWPGLQGAA